ncbi:MAG TPA: glycosyltransferase family A protein, partial [Patescibacteria group bacterium]
MKISVIIPAYNEEKYIGACIESLLKQNRLPDEIIVVNNNSTDQTAAIASQYPVKVINEKEQGITPARNRGLNEAQYDIIARTDADTILPPDWIEKIKKHF